MSLIEDQLQALDLVKQGKSIFLTGIPGAGKSYTLKMIIQYLKNKGKKIAITASTGCAAVLINGQTINSYLCLGIGNKKIETIVQNIKKYNPKILSLQTLIIDEISMIDDKTMDMISTILCKLHDTRQPFGGIQMIFVGDFCQLPPVDGFYCFTSKSWNQLNPECINLTKSFRQEGDLLFQKILEEVRYGKCSKKTFKILQNLQTNVVYNPTKLFALNTDVVMLNNSAFTNLYQTAYKKPHTEAKIIICYPPLVTDILPKEEYEDSCIFCYNAFTNDKKIKTDDYNISLYPGLQVMVTRNINFEKGLINGTIGIVHYLTKTSVCLNVNQTMHIINYYTDLNENNSTYIKFMPIKLAYALSIHKSQGATLDAVEIDGSTFIFAPGQLYTALSRARNLNSIKLINLDKDSFICHRDVKEFYIKKV